MWLPYIHRSRPGRAANAGDIDSLAHALRRDVEVLAIDIGPRGYYAPDRYKLAEEFIVSSVQREGYAVRRLETPAIDDQSHNLEVTIPGLDLGSQVLVVGAHYDSVQRCPAANDNGSGVAGLLALARAFKGRRFRRTLKLVFFANEESPFFNMNGMGSQHYALACARRGERIEGMYCLETIGCYSGSAGSQHWPPLPMGLGKVLPSVGDFIAFVGPTPAARFLRKACAAFKAERAFPLLGAAMPSALEQVNWSDHRGFNEVGYPAFMITDTAPLRYAHYHKPSDTPDKLDFVAMARVVSGVIGMTVRLANA